METSFGTCDSVLIWLFSIFYQLIAYVINVKLKAAGLNAGSGLFKNRVHYVEPGFSNKIRHVFVNHLQLAGLSGTKQ